jgi:N-acetylneuraminic acid mutarotase
LESGCPLPTATFELGAVALNGKIFAMGGSDFQSVLNVVHVYDPVNNVWNSGPSLVVARAALAADALNGRIYVFGGNGSDLNTMEVFDPLSNTWSLSSALMVTGRSIANAADANAQIFALGGIHYGVALNSVEQYSPPATLYTYVKN